ncbi:MAG TPA: protocatechuate 3,4-dioxygenase [Blastocatellia bacterium]|nr:protocatechuate 3,4-dioxygenase [Blastocatellia bacterium]
MKFFGVLCIVLLYSICSGQSYRPADATAPSKIVITSKDEPGEPLVVTGRVFAEDGRTPLAGVSVYVYHTDKRGYYSGESTGNSNPRLRGWMRTDEQGTYEYRTIKPGAYPQGGAPAHIHYVVTGPGYKEKVFEIVFEGDPQLSDRIKADARNEDSGFSLRPITRDKDGTLRVVQDIKLRRE